MAALAMLLASVVTGTAIAADGASDDTVDVAQSETAQTASDDGDGGAMYADTVSVADEGAGNNRVEIIDTILQNGCLTASLTVKNNDATGVNYTWYRSANAEQDGGYEVVQGQTNESISVAQDGARHYYYVVVKLSDDTQVKSAPFQVKYYSSLQNGSFENPARSAVGKQYQLQFNGSYFMQIPNGTDGFIWQTTALGRNYNNSLPNGYYSEIVDTSTGNAANAYGVSKAADGVQYAELNCETAGALYQDVLTVPGSTLYWGLDHSDRSGGQESRLLVLISNTASLPVGFDPTNLDSIAQLGLQDDIQLDVSTSTVGWQYHGGSYTVPEGQYVTRFYFVAGNGATEGNLLDNISFSSELPKPPAEKGNLVLTKAVEGVGEDDLDDLSFEFTVTASDGDAVDDRTVTLNQSNNWTAVFPLDPGDYSVSETHPENIDDDYTYSGTSVKVGDGSSTDSLKAQVTIQENRSTQVSYTNVYQSNSSEPVGEPLSPAKHKYVKDNGDGTYDLSMDVHGAIQTSQDDPTKVDIVYVLDLSYSMMWDMNGNYRAVTKIPAVMIKDTITRLRVITRRRRRSTR